MTSASDITSKQHRIEWVLFGLLFLLSIVVIEQQFLSRPIQLIVGNVVLLNDQLNRSLGPQDANTLIAGAAHERLLNLASLVRKSVRLLEVAVLFASVAFAALGSVHLWLRLGLLIWVVGCVVRPIFMVLH